MKSKKKQINQQKNTEDNTIIEEYSDVHTYEDEYVDIEYFENISEELDSGY